MKCPKCNAEVREGAKFCTSCGNRLAVMSGKTEEPVNGNSENENNPAKRNEAEQRDGITNVRGRIYWNIQPGQVARVIDEAEFDSYNRLNGIIIPEGTTAYLRSNGHTIATINGGTYDFSTSAERKPASESIKKSWGFIIELFGNKKKQQQESTPTEEELYNRQQRAILENANRGAAFSVVILLDKAFPLLIGAKRQNPDDYKNFVPMKIQTRNIDIELGINAYFKITDHENFILHYLTDKKLLNTTHIIDEINDSVRNIVQDVLYDTEIRTTRLPKETCALIKEKLNEAAPAMFFGISIVRIVEISSSNEDIERFRALGRELYLSESELDYLRRTNDFKNRLSDVQNSQMLNEATSELELERRIDEINKDRLLHEDEVEKFKSLLKNERTIREARSDSERDAALMEIERTGLIKKEELQELKDSLAEGTYKRGMALRMMQLRDGIEFEKVRMEGEADKAAAIVRKELEMEAMRDDYKDSRFYKELEQQRRVAETGLDLEQRKRDMDFNDEKRRRELEREEDEEQFRQFLAMQNAEEQSRENQRRHEAEMEKARLAHEAETERMKWENARELSDEKVWALGDKETAAEYARSKYSAEAEREASRRLEQQRREIEDKRDAERRDSQEFMYKMMHDMMAMAGGIQAQKAEERERQIKERDERILRQENRMDTAYDRALDYTTRTPGAQGVPPAQPAPAAPAPQPNPANHAGQAAPAPKQAPAMVTCPECGAKVAENERFCPDCGASI